MSKKWFVCLMMVAALFVMPVSVAASPLSSKDSSKICAEAEMNSSDLKNLKADDLSISIEDSNGNPVAVKGGDWIDVLSGIGKDIYDACKSSNPISALGDKIASWIPGLAKVGTKTAIQGLCIKIGIAGGPVGIVIAVGAVVVVEIVFDVFFDEEAVGDAISDGLYEIKEFVTDAAGKVVSTTTKFVTDAGDAISDALDEIGSAIAELNIGEKISNACNSEEGKAVKEFIDQLITLPIQWI